MIEAPVSSAPPPATLREAFPVSWRLPERVPIVEFLERNRWLSSKFSSNGGAYSLDRYPYLREVYETMTDPEAHWITLVASSQTGKTTLCENYLFYRVANDPTPAIWCFATEDLKNDFIDTKLKPAVLESPAWRALLCDGARAISLQRADFLSMPVFYALADSEASMSMKSCGLVFADETGKFPANTTNEGSPIDQLRERQFTFPRWKFIDTSTPTSANDGIWPSYLASDMRIWSVPCPNCCKFHGWERHNIHHVERRAGQSLSELAGLIDDDRTGALCWWQCPDCAHRVEGPEQQRIINEMNQAGKYIGRGYPKKHVGFLWTKLASPHQTLRDYVAKLLIALAARERGDEAPMKNFTVHYDARPYEAKKIVIEEASIANLVLSDAPRGRVPGDATALTCGVDVQRDCLYFTLWAWSPAADGKIRAHLVDHGRLEDFAALDLVLARSYCRADGSALRVAMTFVDSGDGPITLDIYRYTNRKNPRRLRPIKGESIQSSGGMFWRKGTGGDESAHKGRLIKVYSHETKDFFASLMEHGDKLPLDEREKNRLVSFHAEALEDAEFQRQMASEERAMEGKGRKAKMVWRQRAGGRANHLWAATTYGVAAALFAGLVQNNWRWRKQYRAKTPAAAPAPAEAEEQESPPAVPDRSPAAARRKLHSGQPPRRPRHIPGF